MFPKIFFFQNDIPSFWEDVGLFRSLDTVSGRERKVISRGRVVSEPSRPTVFAYCDLACVAGVNGEGEGERERRRKMGSGS